MASNTCECKPGFQRLGPTCISRCQVNQEWRNGACACVAGTARIQSVCRQCPSNSAPDSNQQTCICSNSQQLFNPDTLQCANCPANSSPNPQRTDCNCNAGFTKQRSNCIANAQCPAGSTWNQAQLTCNCNNPAQHVINGACRDCPNNEVWNGSGCVCKADFFRISGVCRACDPRTTYNGVDCICNVEFYGNRDKCSPCHNTCAQCSGPEASQCLSCVDISYTLKSGFCTRGTCPPGSFLNSKGIC